MSALLFFLLLSSGFPGDQLTGAGRTVPAPVRGQVRIASTAPSVVSGDPIEKEALPLLPFLLYTVEREDTISLTAARFSLKPSTLISLNELVKPGQLKEGMTLYIPGEDGIRRALKEGSTPEELAAQYGLNPEKIVPLGEGDYFLPGGVLPAREEQVFWGDAFSYPMTADISRPYGEGYDELTGLSYVREGLEFHARPGELIHSVGDGLVVKAGFHGTYGWYMIINHRDNLQSLYAHLESFKVEQGARVERGEVIASSGNSGHTPGNILYFSLFKNGETVNPGDYLF